MTQGVHRHPAGTKAARQIMAMTSINKKTPAAHDQIKTMESDWARAAWNARVDAAKKARKEQKHGA